MEKLGLTVQNLTEELAKQFGYEELKGILISNVRAGSPAAFVQLRPGMLILEVNRQTVESVSDMVKALCASDKIKKVLLLLSDGALPVMSAFLWNRVLKKPSKVVGIRVAFRSSGKQLLNIPKLDININIQGDNELFGIFDAGIGFPQFCRITR